MFDDLIAFIEETVFSRINLILTDNNTTEVKCAQALHLLLTFAERNPGITRILTGDPLAGESDRLRVRVGQFFDRFETQLKQILREAEIRGANQATLDIANGANLMLACVEGKISQYVRSDFSRRPTEAWDDQWRVLQKSIFG